MLTSRNNRALSQKLPAYMASTNGTVSTGTALATVNSIAYLFRPAASTRRIEIYKIEVGFVPGTTGRYTFRGAFITAENGVPGGISQTINPVDRDDPASIATVFRTGATGAPTRLAGDLMTWEAGAQAGDFILFDATVLGKPIVLRASVTEGFEVRTVVEVALGATAGQVACTYYWSEI